MAALRYTFLLQGMRNCTAAEGHPKQHMRTEYKVTKKPAVCRQQKSEAAKKTQASNMRAEASLNLSGKPIRSKLRRTPFQLKRRSIQ